MDYLSSFKSEKDFNRYVTKRLKFIRESNNLTQSKFSEKLNMSEQNYARIERGEYRASTYFILLVCSKFDITISQFFNFKDSSKDAESTQFFNELLIKNKDDLLKFSKFINDYYLDK